MTSPRSNGSTRSPRSWLIRYLTLQKAYDREIKRALLQASKDAEARIKKLRGKVNISAKVEIAQLRSVQGVVRQIVRDLWTDIEKITRRGQVAAARAAVETSFLWDEFLFTRSGMTAEQRAAMKASVMQTAAAGVEAAVARITQSRSPLSSRVYYSRDLVSGALDRRISAALARGASWKQLSDEVRSSIRPDVKGGVSYAANRLARTEINNAYHAVSIAHNENKPWVESMNWATSGSHPKPDICDLYADRSPYPKDSVPKKPHPHCFCYTYPNVVDESEFIRGLRSGQYDNYIAATYGQRSSRVA